MNLSPNDLLVLLNDLAHAIRTEADRRARQHGLTRAQWHILARLSRTPGLSQRELAESLEVEPITVARLVDRLEVHGLVERRADAADRRIWRLHLRPEADSVLAIFDAHRKAMIDCVTEGLDEETLAIVVPALQRMKTNILASRRSAAVSADAAEEESQA